MPDRPVVPAVTARCRRTAGRVPLGPGERHPLRRAVRAAVLGLLTVPLVVVALPDAELAGVPAAKAVPAASGPLVATTTAASTAAEPGAQTALALLDTLAVKGRSARTGYARDAFGPAWADHDRNGCDTRNDILARDLTGETFQAGTRRCVVVTGRLAEPYTGRQVLFRKQDAAAVHIDHVVALSDAWQKGAQPWPAAKRLAFANDPLNLLAVDGPANLAKGDSDAATWLPPNRAYRCPFVARQVAVKATYRLWVTAAERAAMARTLSACPQQAVPSGGSPTTAAPAVAGPPKTYANCTALRADHRGGVARQGAVNRGGATTHRPHYDDALYAANKRSDRDGDGIACEA